MYLKRFKSASSGTVKHLIGQILNQGVERYKVRATDVDEFGGLYQLWYLYNGLLLYKQLIQYDQQDYNMIDVAAPLEAVLSLMNQAFIESATPEQQRILDTNSTEEMKAIVCGEKNTLCSKLDKGEHPEAADFLAATLLDKDTRVLTYEEQQYIDSTLIPLTVGGLTKGKRLLVFGPLGCGSDLLGFCFPKVVDVDLAHLNRGKCRTEPLVFQRLIERITATRGIDNKVVILHNIDQLSLSSADWFSGQVSRLFSNLICTTNYPEKIALSLQKVLFVNKVLLSYLPGKDISWQDSQNMARLSDVLGCRDAIKFAFESSSRYHVWQVEYSSRHQRLLGLFILETMNDLKRLEISPTVEYWITERDQDHFFWLLAKVVQGEYHQVADVSFINIWDMQTWKPRELSSSTYSIPRSSNNGAYLALAPDPTLQRILLQQGKKETINETILRNILVTSTMIKQ